MIRRIGIHYIRESTYLCGDGESFCGECGGGDYGGDQSCGGHGDGRNRGDGQNRGRDGGVHDVRHGASGDGRRDDDGDRCDGGGGRCGGVSDESGDGRVSGDCGGDNCLICSSRLGRQSCFLL